MKCLNDLPWRSQLRYSHSMSGPKQIILVIMLCFFSTSALSSDNIRKIISPKIIGKTLYITGSIDSHIYDFLSYEYKAIESVQQVSLNSFGGSHDWGLEIAKKIQGLELTTIIEENSVCASACAYIFSSGIKRIIHSNTWIGVHGARMSDGYKIEFMTKCPHLKNKVPLLIKKECASFLSEKYDLSMKATIKGFSLMEASGVSKSLQKYYFSMEDDPEWYLYFNILRKPDWIITPEVALHFNLATQIKN